MFVKPIHPPHAVDQLRQECKTQSSRPFIARGANIQRCKACLLSLHACICHLRKTSTLNVDFILLYHLSEIHKPTNSGRLIADLFPHNTHAFLWSRTEPPVQLLNFIHDSERDCRILFPDKHRQYTNSKLENTANAVQSINSQTQSSKPRKLTFIILDGTWKQASKMFHQSRWLSHLNTLEINTDQQRSFLLRKSQHQQQFATAEVVSMLLHQTALTDAAEQLMCYYQAFNTRALSTRRKLA